MKSWYVALVIGMLSGACVFVPPAAEPDADDQAENEAQAQAQVRSQSQAELVRALFEHVWATGDVSPLEGAGADSVLFHYRGSASYTSLSELGGLIQHWKSAFPDFRMDLHDVVADGDLVAARVTYSGTHEGVWFGIPATGREVEVDEMMFFRFEDGLLVEMWEVDDQLTMRGQMGLFPR